jgi:hypothetical protein
MHVSLGIDRLEGRKGCVSPTKKALLFLIHKRFGIFKNSSPAGRWWLLPVILATQEAEIRRIMI